MPQATFRIWRGDKSGGQFKDYTVDVGEGVVVLDCVHQIQATQAGDLACRWNCKAGKCGSCSAEINGKPRLMCMTRMDTIPMDAPIILEPMHAFPLMRDLVTDVSWNYTINKRIPPFKPRPPDAPDGTWRMSQEEVDRIQEFRKCIECFLCQDTCHVLRDHHMMGEAGKPPGEGGELFGGPRFMIRVASLEMHPLDTANRLRLLKEDLNIGLCNITKCCTEVCPEHIHITDNGIIPLKERVVDEFYDPVLRLIRGVGKLFGLGQKERAPLPVVSNEGR
jgi:succinate dehydrogenase / fumarate reductase iron-sulfur subunit